ncbi:MAG: hypothetical protein BRD55_09120 [Bacteroidetes bacterium SW_9_63_38]|nr:MAG: hypothetical protein BRD55_09120 [Bacteroidetes bacterium SW_9_63_38]
MLDLHLTEDGDVETVRGAVRQNERVDPDLANRIRETVEGNAAEALTREDLEGYTLSAGVELVTGRVPGAPRERITITLDFEGEDSVVAAVDDAVSAPDRARIADELETTAYTYLQEHNLDDVVDVTVSVTPIQFR